jgi:hypothetical protein
MSDGAAEIAQIEHEFAILRDRYALYHRGAAWVRRTLIGACAIVAGLIAWRLVLGDFFGVVLTIIFSAIFGLWCLPYRKRRLIDIVSEARIPIYSGRRGAREVEDMIALREKRLAELKGLPREPHP